MAANRVRSAVDVVLMHQSARDGVHGRNRIPPAGRYRHREADGDLFNDVGLLCFLLGPNKDSVTDSYYETEMSSLHRSSPNAA